MYKFTLSLLLSLSLVASQTALSQPDSIVLKNLDWDPNARAGSTELFIPSGGVLMPGLIYRANGTERHPTLLLLHGYPGNERNLDLAQVVRARGWNVIYFDYRGSWGSQGRFSFKNCVEDVINVVAFCKKYQDSFHIDTANIDLFGHSMGGFVCLKALQQLPEIKKGFALSTWDIYGNFKKVMNEKELHDMVNNPQAGVRYFVLNATVDEIFGPVIKDREYFNLVAGAPALSGKQIIMLDEHAGNKPLADAIKSTNKAWFDYEVWPTDHSFTNKRVSLIRKLLEFLDR
jgi:pimeloyl-ACP methyl ester carboxylesterase